MRSAKDERRASKSCSRFRSAASAAGEQSGTLITARLALDYNREVLVVPHEIGHNSGLGCNALLRGGATLVRDSNDILEALGFKPTEPTQLTLPGDLSDAEKAAGFKLLFDGKTADGWRGYKSKRNVA